MTVLEVIQRSAGFLAKKDVESPRLQVELMLAHLLKLPRMGLYLNFERKLTDAELDDLRKMVQRRGQREPLQHILGSTSFCGLEIAVNGEVLVPRPETELLAELGWEFLNAKWKNGSVASVDMLKEQPPEGGTPNMTVLDFGTGSGCLAIALAMKCTGAQIVALDVSPAALVVARKNAERHNVELRIRFIEGNGFAGLPTCDQFDLIAANPPYIPSEEIAALEPEVREHDPRLALDGGPDGLDFYRQLAREAGAFLKPGGRVMMEFGDGQSEAIQKIFSEQKWVVEAVKADYNGRSRIMVVRLIR